MTGSKSQRAYEQLRTRIRGGEIAPGRRLVLSQLAAELEMSVVPVREAVRLLEAEGLVRFEKNVGARVATLDAEEYVQTMHTLAIVEGAATALAAPLCTAADLAEARAINHEIEQGLADFDAEAYARLNRAFHAVLTRRCPNRHLRDLVEDAWARVSMVRDPAVAFHVRRARASVAEHESLLQLIEQRADDATIERAVRAHRAASGDAAFSR